MSPFTQSLAVLAAASVASIAFVGCQSTDQGGSQVSGSIYYGDSFYDPWYYGDYYDDVDVIVTPPERPTEPPKPAHPIALPPPSMPRPTPMPSIPRMPMPRAR